MVLVEFVVKDIIFADGALPPDQLPLTTLSWACILSDDGSVKEWVPILPVTANWLKSNASGKRESLHRKAFPLILSWAYYTPWKGQGYNQLRGVLYESR